ncbi:hypothetical protein [Epiphyas postvittana nucleopolyhedrovirus]|uniref:Uncharacterized protein n=1 Tax=Epiphyas postvittana nucleopolyhedrovirus TaxID=70600 RepID=Q91GN8_NPVEP|nr:hypothetical protein [Epiphyas postvittana nucleopolyhedrovirus]AAK85573.1 unknown [Epiphyas postvittana nucleopolyhedrovirus]
MSSNNSFMDVDNTHENVETNVKDTLLKPINVWSNDPSSQARCEKGAPPVYFAYKCVPLESPLRGNQYKIDPTLPALQKITTDTANKTPVLASVKPNNYQDKNTVAEAYNNVLKNNII